MTAKAALIYHLLKGDVLTIGSGFTLIGLTNIPREISRSVEKDFGVEVSRLNIEAKNRYGYHIYFFQYRLNRTEYNSPGIEKMKDYLRGEAKGHPDEKKFLKVCNPALF